jgi:hypothetical protein
MSLCFHFTVKAQGKEKIFEFDFSNVPNYKNSFYKTIKLVDNRIEPDFMGFVQVGAFNSVARVVPDKPLQSQLDIALRLLTDKYLGEDTLVLQLNHFNFAEVTGLVSEKGYFNLNANLYGLKDQNCYLLSRIDTTYEVKALDVTNKVIKDGCRKLLLFISESIDVLALENPTSTPIENIINTDSLEKIHIPIYNDTTYISGGYFTYDSFKNQKPDIEIIPVFNEKGKIEKLLDKSSDIEIDVTKYYSFVINGKPYIRQNKKIYPILKNEKNVLYFKGKSEDKGKQTAVASGVAVGFGLIGAAIYLGLGNAPSSTYMTLIDHRNGDLIPVRKL